MTSRNGHCPRPQTAQGAEVRSFRHENTRVLAQSSPAEKCEKRHSEASLNPIFTKSLTQNMKSKMNFSKTFKALFVAGLVAGPMLAFSAKAADNSWAPVDTFSYANGNQ